MAMRDLAAIFTLLPLALYSACSSTDSGGSAGPGGFGGIGNGGSGGTGATGAGGATGGTGAGINPDASTGTCPTTPCASGKYCLLGQCVDDFGPCTVSADGKDDSCENDSYCENGKCIPYGSATKQNDTECAGEGFAAEQLKEPTVRCSWTTSAVISTPMVADLDGDKKPEIVFPGFNSSTTGASLFAIHADDCSLVFNKPANLGSRSQVAIGDLTGDGKPEIVAIQSDNRVVVFDNVGNVVATSPTAATTTSSFKDGGAALMNLDGQGPPEIIYAGQVLRLSGNTLTVLFNHSVAGGHWGVMTAAADVDLDGQGEIIVGNRIYDGITGADETPAGVSGFPGGYVAIAQWDKSTPEPEIVLISSQSGKAGTIRIYHPKTGNVVFGPYTFGQQWGGPPTVADFDGDGEPEVGSAGYTGYVVFDRECAATPLPSFCVAPGIRWQKPTKDNSSGSTGSSVFDFNGDGKAEVVYRDECWMRVYDGTTGQVRFARPLTSGTILENPVIVDVDNDNHADLVVPTHGSGSGFGCTTEPDLSLPHTGAQQGIWVLQDPDNRWMPSRAIWNQHTYHITNINDDATIPVKEANNWDTFNNYRQNVQGLITDKPPMTDLTGGETLQDACKTGWELKAQLCNRGTLEAPPGVPGTFYLGDPAAGGTVICTTQTKTTLSPGSCETVSCIYASPPDGPVDLWFVADDDGTATGSSEECKEQNNRLHLPGAQCGGGPPR
ncbi:MAG: FG-GAP-like repeat-containing protein [Polyangiaceae bacterium]